MMWLSRIGLSRCLRATHPFERWYSQIRLFGCSVRKEKDNVVLMGSPGSGKTTVGRILSKKLAMPVVDVDNDFLETYWNMPVAQKLLEVGHGKFVEAEGKAFMNFNISNHIVSLTGSNPMYRPAQDHLRSLGPVVYLDVDDKIVTDRLEILKNLRIVGEYSGQPIGDTLKYRKQFYEGVHDIRILVRNDETVEETAEKVLKELKLHQAQDGYRSTRSAHEVSSGQRKSFLDVVREGLAQDGGLYVPSGDIPVLHSGELSRLIGLSYKDLAQRLLERWLSPQDLHPRLLSQMVSSAYNKDIFDCAKVCPTIHLKDNIYVMELFHGPTASFKDFALQLMPQFFQKAICCDGLPKHKYLILVATSGDTGSAVLDGFIRHTDPESTKLMVLYPEEGISDIQKHQMASVRGRNVQVMGVQSDFDFCQTTIKDIFNDNTINNKLLTNFNTKLSAANSINWGRLLPQVVYHVSSYIDLVKQGVVAMDDKIDLCIPTGNFGNILSAYYAKKMGLPIRRLILASNKNNILTEFFQTGCYDLRSRNLKVTMSPAIDILKSSNLERFLFHKSGGWHQNVDAYYSALGEKKFFQVSEQFFQELQQDVVADWCSEDDCSKTIRSTFEETGMLLDPHTAVAKTVAGRHNQGDIPLVIAATAHYAKFAPDVLKSLGASTEGSPSEMLDTLEQIGGKPIMHRRLKETLLRERVHKTMCSPMKGEILKELISFADKQ
ncbi:threonine synthase-like 1 [Lineus longissimus]|uniref:threonine synthase-like 1 n=1 Tax=Lineus longissimus TaxID=88925 RepID=UPI002B4ECA6A